MKDWHFWNFVAFIWLTYGIFAPWPLSLFFFIGAAAFGIFSYWIQRAEAKLKRIEDQIQHYRFRIIDIRLREITRLLGGKKMQKRKGGAYHDDQSFGF